ALGLLLAPEIFCGCGNSGMVRSVADLGEEAQTTGGHISRWRVEQRAMIRERDVVQVVVRVVGIEGGPPTVPALHTDDPFGGAVYGLAIAGRIESVESESNRGRVVEIGIV